MARRVIWAPQPKQALFMARPEAEALYGGAAGGGKSDSLLMEALRQVHIPHYRGLILRKTYPQISELVDRSLLLYSAAFAKAKYNDSKHVWTFQSGAKIFFGSMQYTKDRVNYQGKRYDFIGFDELTQFLWEEYSYMFSRNRPSGTGTRCYIRATANPGGIGHGWVKERFISAGAPMQTIRAEVNIQFPDGQEQTRVQNRIFVPSSVFDNSKLLQADPDYLTRLAGMPENERNALLYGNWDAFAGQVFTEWRNDSDHYQDRINTHVIDPFLIPDTWTVYRGFDFGYAKPFSVGWYAVDHDRRLYRIRELYGCTGAPDTGVKWEPARIAREIRRVEREDPNLKGRQVRGIADPAIWQASMGDSVATVMEHEGVYFDKGDHARIAGKMQVHHRLAFDKRGVPLLYVFRTCRHCIRTLPALVYDDTDVEDINTRQEDHIYDELRYVCMENPVAPGRRKAPELIVYDPLDAGTDIEYGRYDFYRKG